MKEFLSAISKEALNKIEPKFRRKQIIDWVYKKQELNPDNMRNLPLDLRENLKNEFHCSLSSIKNSFFSNDGTTKLLIKLQDGACIESVIIPSKKRVTFCLSTQVGCPVKCKFCASGAKGLVRNLTAGEIIEQYYLTCQAAKAKPTNLVFMGIGEGLLNYDNLITSLDILCQEDKINFAARKITVSTSGISKNIIKLADLKRQWTLAISLHATNDELRKEIIPEPFREKIEDILNAASYYKEQTGRIVTMEYTLIKDFNDAEKDAKKLAYIAVNRFFKVNIIPYNNTENNDYQCPDRDVIDDFMKILEEGGALVTLRESRGNKKQAACGQLAITDIL